MSSWRTLRMLSAAVLLCLPHAAFGQEQTGGPSEQQNQQQNQQPGQPGETPAPANVVPDELVQRILSGDATAVADVRAFLTSGQRKPEVIAQRAAALISQIGGQKGEVNTETLLRVIDQIASSAINLVAGAQIVKMGIDSGYIPRSAVVAMDFGTADSEAPPGFERVQPGDPRIAGSGLKALRRPSENEMLGGGISGIERIEVDVPDGEYRVILMTQNLGDQSLMGSPFGRELVVNGSAISVGQPSADDWLPGSLLSNRGSELVRAQATPGGSSGFGSSSGSGFLSGDFGSNDQSVFQRQAGGALIVPAVARGGKLIIELRGAGNAASYLTGLMVEPAAEPSDLVLSREAESALVPPELRLALEENILAAAATVLADIDPAAGDSELVELPEPILDPEENASISS